MNKIKDSNYYFEYQEEPIQQDEQLLNKAPKVIGIFGASGMGKTTLTNAFGQALHATKIFWDDYNALSKEPDGYMK